MSFLLLFAAIVWFIVGVRQVVVAAPLFGRGETQTKKQRRLSGGFSLSLSVFFFLLFLGESTAIDVSTLRFLPGITAAIFLIAAWRSK